MHAQPPRADAVGLYVSGRALSFFVDELGSPGRFQSKGDRSTRSWGVREEAGTIAGSAPESYAAEWQLEEAEGGRGHRRANLSRTDSD